MDDRILVEKSEFSHVSFSPASLAVAGGPRGASPRAAGGPRGASSRGAGVKSRASGEEPWREGILNYLKSRSQQDEHEAFGQYMAFRLRSMNPRAAHRAQLRLLKVINEEAVNEW